METSILFSLRFTSGIIQEYDFDNIIVAASGAKNMARAEKKRAGIITHCCRVWNHFLVHKTPGEVSEGN